MAYYTGLVNSFADLKAVIEGAAVDSGWAIVDGILSKDAVFIQLIADASGGMNQLRLIGGTGRSGGSLVGAPSVGSKIADHVKDPIAWPATYHVFAFFDEIYCVVNHSVEMYKTLGFGISDIPGIGGTGGWFFAQLRGNAANTSDNSFRMTIINGDAGSLYTQDYYSFRSIPWSGQAGDSAAQVHCALNGAGWVAPKNAMSYMKALLTALPSPLNSAHILLPLKAVVPMPAGGLTIAVQHKNLRFMRVDNILPGDVISYGGEKWKCFPWMKRDVVKRYGVDSYNEPTVISSGTFGFAVRYEGP